MGYRDDTDALKSQVGALQQDNTKLGQRLIQLGQKSGELERQLRQARWRILRLRLSGWIKRNPMTALLLLLIAGIAGYIPIRQTLDQRRLDRAVEARVAALGQGCQAQLIVKASLKGAAVWVKNSKLGPAPMDLKICPGSYTIHVTHPATGVWTRRITIQRQQKRTLYARLAGHNVIGDGMLIHSVPEGALLYLNGREMGETPALVEVPDSADSGVQLTLRAEGYDVVNITVVPRSAEAYVQLGRPQAERVP